MEEVEDPFEEEDEEEVEEGEVIEISDKDRKKEDGRKSVPAWFKKEFGKKKVRVRDPLATIRIAHKDGRVYYRRPTQLQMRAAQYLAKGLSKRQSMLKAGYATESADTKAKLLDNVIESTLTEQMKNKLLDKGLGIDKVAEKLGEFIDAKTTLVTKDGEVEVEDRKTQIAAVDRVSKFLGIDGGGASQKGTGKKITIEQWTYGDEDQ